MSSVIKIQNKTNLSRPQKALEIISHFISVKLIYNAVSTECGTHKMTFIQSKTPQPIRFANHNSIDEVANAKRGKSARLPSVFPLIGWASRTRLFLNAKQSNGGIVFGTYWKYSVFNCHKFPRSFKTRHKHFSVRKSSTSAVHGGAVRPQRNQIYNQINFLLETVQLLFQTQEILTASLSKLSQLRVKSSYLLILFLQSALQVLYVLIRVISVSCWRRCQ